MSSLLRSPSKIFRPTGRAVFQRTLVVPAATAAVGAALLGDGIARHQKHPVVHCQEQRPNGGTSATVVASGCCESGVRFYGARSRSVAASSCCYAVAERLHQFAVVDGIGGSDEARECATFCARRLAPLVAQAFAAGQQAWQSGNRPQDTDAKSLWAEALTAGFQHCDMLAVQEANGSCGALLCVVAQSGVYVASLGLSRAVVGTEDDGGATILCDEVSVPHSLENEAEAERLQEAGLAVAQVPNGPTRMLGGMAVKRDYPGLIVSVPDVVRHEHTSGRRFVIMASPGVWRHGPRLPLQWAVDAYRRGLNPAKAVVEHADGSDVAALVLVLNPGLGLGERGSSLAPDAITASGPSLASL